MGEDSAGAGQCRCKSVMENVKTVQVQVSDGECAV
jgi:hypothetical protein